MEEILHLYYEDNARRLHGIVDRILSRFGGLSDKDHDDFYSLANEVFVDVMGRYDGKQSFEAFLYSCLVNKIKTEMTARNRQKRLADRCCVSMDTPVGEEEGVTLGDVIPADFDMDRIILEKTDVFFDGRIKKYLDSLNRIQRQIVRMKMEDVPTGAIKERLGLTGKQYEHHMEAIRSYENTKYLLRDMEPETVPQKEDIELMNNMETTTTSEKTKNTSYAISAISKKLRRYQLRDNHVLQRLGGQFSNYCKSELVSDILQGLALTQIIISEEIKNGVTMYWLIDGKQRCTSIEEYLNDGFAISKNVQTYNITYQTFRKDERNEEVLNEDGFPIPENRVFDIRNKKFSQLPEELQDKFLEYQVPVMLNLNCTKKEIAYDIARFNRCRPMTVAQNGWTGLKEEYAEMVDNILKMDFFKEDSGISRYLSSSNKSGMMRRMVVESIMAINYPDSFSKDFRRICEFLSEEANAGTFIEFYSLIERLSDICNEEIADMFNIKDSFLYFALFARFSELGLEDGRFADFLLRFQTELHGRAVDGVTYDELNNKSTKDRAIVLRKLDHLEALMRDYFAAGEEE